MLVLGIEGSANKIGVGIVSDNGDILSNPRHTYELLTNTHVCSCFATSVCQHCLLMSIFAEPRPP